MVLILYLSIVLIIVGAIFLITSIEVVKSSGSTMKSGSGGLVREMSEISEPSVFSGTARQDDSPSGRAGTTSSHAVSDIAPPSDQSGMHEFDVTLYNDDNGVAFRDSSEILSDISMTKGIMRVGKGIAEVGDSGLTVRIEKTLYRFDYYRLDRIESNGNFAILSLSGVRGKSILLSDHEAFPKKLNERFSSFKGLQG